MRWSFGLLVVAFLASAAAQEQFACDPLVPEYCYLPFPNDFWRNSSSGNLFYLPDTLPLDNTKKTINPTSGGWNDLDGFSPAGALLAYFPDANVDNCAHFWNIGDSLLPTSPTILLNTETMQIVPHWIELDHMSDVDHSGDYNRTFIMWPAVRLNDSTRYIAAMTNILNSKGQPVTTSPGFAALRDNFPTHDPAIESRRQHFNEDIFPLLQAINVTQTSLTLAWDFTVQSTRSQTNRMVTMRDDGFSRVNGNDIKFVITQVKENPQPNVARQIEGLMTIPWYLNQVNPGIHVRLVTDPNDVNVPVYQRMQDVYFTVLIPPSLANGTYSSGPVLQYGHGLFGSQSEVLTAYLDDEADRYGYVLGAVDWLGMCYEDEAFVGEMMLTDVTNFAMIPDRSHQGMLSAQFLMRLMTSPSFVNNEHLMYNGRSVIDPSQRYYYGNSQGGIMGTVYMGITQDVTRGVIGVGGGPYTLLLPRSADFTDLYDIIRPRYFDPVDRSFLLAWMQLLWNRAEPTGYLPHITADPLPNTPQHRVVLHYGLADAQVSWLGAQLVARSVGASMYSSNCREYNETLFGYNFISDDTVLSGPADNLIQGWDFQEPYVPFINIPPSKSTDTHEFTRRTMTAQEQTHLFLTTGQIRNFCNGTCVCPRGPC